MKQNNINGFRSTILILMLSTVLVGCGILKYFIGDDPTQSETIIESLNDPFFGNCRPCSSSDFAGSRAIGSNNCHCCEKKAYYTTETDSLFTFNSNQDTGRAKVSIKGFLKGALGIGADAAVSFVVVETRRDVAIHQLREDHCEKHTRSSVGDCDESFLKEKRRLSALISSNQGFNWTTEFALSRIKGNLDAEGGFNTVNGRREFRMKNFYMCLVSNHERCNGVTSSIPAHFTRDTSICK